jgi:hypothetical protein
VIVSVHLHGSLTASPDSPTGILHGAEHRAIRQLAALVEDAATLLETSARYAPPTGLIPECNAALEACLERLREDGDRDDLVRTASDDLKRLGRLLKLVDGMDLPFVMRQIRRVLGRFDACGGRLLEEHPG